MADTTHLLLPLLAAAQAQKHVTHNDALLRLDALVQLSVKDRDLAAPPANPSDGDRYIPASGASGAWAGWDLNIAWFVDGVWTKLVPREGWRLWVEDEELLLVWTGLAWVAIDVGAGAPAPGLFYVFRDVAQTGLQAGVFNLLELNGIQADLDGWYSTSNFRFMPQAPGWYLFYMDAQVAYATASREGLAVAVYKNGAVAIQGGPMLVLNASSVTIATAYVAGLVSMNGTTDFIDFRAYIGNGAGSSSTNGGKVRNFAGGLKLRDL